MKNTNKEKEQLNAFNAWIKNKCRGTIEGATGFGKTRIGIMAAARYAKKYDYKFKILIIVPDTNLRDNEWEKEFKKWKEEKVWKECVTIVCIQTAYKWRNTHWDLVIVDEIHDVIPSIKRVDYKYGTFFYNNGYRGILGLSGSINFDKKERLKLIAPVVYSLHTEEAKDLNLISNFKIYMIPCKLNEKERQLYDKLTREIDSSEFQNWSKINERLEILFNCEDKINKTRKLIELSEGYGIIFNMRNQLSDKIAEGFDFVKSYHSGKSTKERKEIIKQFSDGRTKLRVLSTTKALNQGANLPRLTWGILVSGTSKEKDPIQRLGRTVRFEENKNTIFVRLYCEHTVEEAHLKKSLIKFKSKEHINFDKFLEIWQKKS